MKAMKYFKTALLMATLCCGLNSCGGEDYVSRLKELILKDVTFDNGADSKVLTFRNEDLSNYAANSNQDWCTVIIGESTITIRVLANDTYDDRTATITLADIKDGISSRTFTVTQAQAAGVVVNTKEYEMEMAGGEITVEVLSNVEYFVKSDVDWIKYVETRGLTSSTVVLQVGKNNTGVKRSGTVRIINSETDEIEVVKVSQSFTPVYSVSPSSLSIDELGGELEISVKANFPVDAFTYDNWVTKTRRETNDDGFVQKIKVSEFTLKQPSRSTYVTFENPSYNMAEIVRINQYRTLYIPESIVELLVGDSVQVAVYNPNGIDVVWKSLDEKVAQVNEKGYVKGIEDGTAVIKVTSKDGLYSDNIKVVVEKPLNVEDYLGTSWEQSNVYGKDSEGNDSVIAVNISCTLENDSPYDIELTRCLFYNTGRIILTRQYDSSTGVLHTGDKTTVSVRLEEEMANPYFVWEYMYYGEERSFKVRNPLVVDDDD